MLPNPDRVQVDQSGSPATTATSHALALPEIVHEIFLWIMSDHASTWKFLKDGVTEEPNDDTDWSDWEESHRSYGRHGVLVQCAQVNRLWFREAVPFIWPDLADYEYYRSLPEFFVDVPDLARRQFYASFVEQADLRPVEVGESPQAVDQALSGVTFPKIQSLRLRLPGCYEPYHLPRVCCPKMVTLEIDPRFEYMPDTYCVLREEWDEMLRQIPMIFPNLETVRIIDRARVHPGALEQFAARLPLLKVFEHSKVIESAEPY
ncbi:hypothetical protein BO94DRAFT_547793 [Aspergillus sclerotioniger CBS 115572]|uniref:F-box domain-containing protein n=1 Tax=Aspergillus sclerotioniger CBS 115572 TaxID=1450535 RepID=A0A317W872_9EURO|nr:hypothetical protein BO94DRAFT_547793 [Aspergillus sclerotioniger CBS 115572]PWY81507.1 hypothetical protein BO94DRAFT_547793 [Aspergillus sclerotioniger CBS 115572]